MRLCRLPGRRDRHRGVAPGRQSGDSDVSQHWGSRADVVLRRRPGRRPGRPARSRPAARPAAQALTGWVPDQGVSPLARSPQASPVSYINGFFYFPLVFTANFVFPRVKSWKP
ncbi:phage tail terminator protein [Pseudomonas aeruginosa]|uniref:phage tail terminator protein n=1 Tax=Pseudomonas aeruginosa TaxID=287 RepID=UPI003D7A54A1